MKATIHPDAESLFQKLKNSYCKSISNIYLPSISAKGSYPCAYSQLPESVIERCESPIEQLLAVAISFVRLDLMTVRQQIDVTYYADFPDQKEYHFRPDFIIGLDWTLLTPGWEFAARGNWWDTADAYKWLPFFAVECDGRDYHNDHIAIEKDKQRDRVFSTRGMQVLRYTGSEINKDSIKCAEEVVQLFKFMLRERLKPGVKTEELIQSGGKFVLGQRWAS